MPNDTKDRRDLTPEELAAKEERFRSFFSTTAVELPEEKEAIILRRFQQRHQR